MADANEQSSLINDLKINNLEAERDLYKAKLQKNINGDISLSFGLNQYGDQFLLAYQKPSVQQSYMVNFRIPLLNWGINRNSYEIAKYRYKIALTESEEKYKSLIEYLHAVVDEYNFSVQVVNTAKRQAELALKQYRLSVTLFSNGHNTFFELATSRKQYLEAEYIYMEQYSKMWINYYIIRSLTLNDY